MSIDELVTLLIGCQEPQLYCYVLIDPTAISGTSDPSIREDLYQALGKDALTPVLRADLPHAPNSHPVLACLAVPGKPLNPALLHLTATTAAQDTQRRKHQVCGWLFSEAPASVLAPHLSAICMLPTAGGGTRFYPVFEPARLEMFAASFGQVIKGPWWPVKHWFFYASGGVPVSLVGQPGPRHPVASRASVMQDEAVLIMTALKVWRAQLAEAAAQTLAPIPDVAATWAYDHIEHGRKLGLSSFDDLITYTLLHLYLHRRLHAHPAVRALIDQAVREQRPLAPLFAHYRDGNWKHVISTLPPVQARP